MRFVAWQPSITTMETVECFWEIEGTWSGGRVVLPKPVVDLGFDLYGAPGTGWIAGIHDGPLVRAAGRVHQIGIRFRPGAARALLKCPIGELSRRITPLESVLGPLAILTGERLAQVRDATERARILESFVASRLRSSPRFSSGLSTALMALRDSGGRVPVSRIWRRSGMSYGRLLDLFHSEVGLTPKNIARILRLHHALALLRRGSGGSLGRIAAELGFADQAHFTNEFRCMTGQPPGSFRRSTR
jgi:AraC-like DNA-binding protein